LLNLSLNNKNKIIIPISVKAIPKTYIRMLEYKIKVSLLNFVPAINNTATADGQGINPATIPVINGLENFDLLK
tara:strand:+ start:282 stop:503 length:222 start_codon:yes stop_codon:yes gene_type:complete